MRYDRKIKYLDYLENGERVRGGGFLKLETADTLFRLELTVKGVRGAGGFSPEVILCGNGREEVWGKLQLENGQGELRQECQVESGIGGTGINCRELSGIRIPLGEGKEIVCRWEAAEASDSPSVKESAKPGKAGTAEGREKHVDRKHREIRIAERILKLTQNGERGDEEAGSGDTEAMLGDREAISVDRAGGSGETGNQSQSGKRFQEAVGQSVERGEGRIREADGQPVDRGEGRIREAASQPVERVEGAGSRAPASRRQPEAVPLLEDKWLQLCAVYPHIKPFQDQREYLSIRPEDFVLLSADSYKAAGNSFMLHGYYNYRHLILAREERRGGILYYVGVPGNYYDREKQVAVMFGFESFECAQEPAQSSDFGYYMMRVQI